MNISTRILNRQLVRVLLAGMLLSSAFVTDMFADVTIKIGGNVYGGGKDGAVGTSHTSSTTTKETPKEEVTITDNSGTPVKVTEVVVNAGTIKDGSTNGKIFGGGMNGRAYGGTSVTVNGGEMNMVFGAGDGSGAVVFGHDQVLIKNGTINNNVYGGGNEADLIGTTKVILQGGTIKEDVYGGSRIADIYGYTYVDIDGANAKNDLIIKNIYGGNDISGRITSSTIDNWAWAKSENLTVPFTISTAGTMNASGTVDKTWNAFIRSTKNSDSPVKNIFIGKLYGGGNGDYGTEYDAGGLYAGKTLPVIDKVYLQIEGGNFGYLLGGGNNATVLQSTDIYINNESDPVQLTEEQVNATGISKTAFTESGGVYTANNQFDGVFGGNDRADMAIRPDWYLNKASINNLYSGGNAGRMIYYEEVEGYKKGGIILELNSDDLTVNNVYGGCRKADVRPLNAGLDATFDAETFDGIVFPANYSARVLVKKGTIQNVYGGNDVSGKVYGGNALEILSTINGNVYGGGNGNYPYTDKTDSFTEHPDYVDYLFTVGTGEDPIDAMNDFRPNAESVRLHVAGTSTKQTYIGGELYVGGNSATLKSDKTGAEATLIIGAYVTADNMFLGSNGINMKEATMMNHYKDNTFSSVVLDSDSKLAKYMEGADVSIMPTILFDDMEGAEYSTFIGAFHVGGNAGSMSVPGTITMNFNQPVTIYKRVVGGSNDAKVTFTNGGTYTHNGGLLAATASGTPKIIINFNEGDNGGIRLLPRVLTETAGVYSLDTWSTEEINSNTYLEGANIYGGCYTSGIVNGGVEINLRTNFFSDDDIFGASKSGVEKEDQLYVFSKALSAYGGGFGENTTINGDTRINMYSGNILKVFGGGLKGVVDGSTTINLADGNVGKIYGGGFEGNINGNTRVNLDGGNVIDAFGGACNADIGGYAQMFLGSGAGNNGTPGLTTVAENVYGGNDYGGNIIGSNTTLADVNINLTDKSMIYKYDAGAQTAAVLQSSAYVEYRLGNVQGNIFGGSCGNYTYTTQSDKPYVVSSFVNFRPTAGASLYNKVTRIFGASQGVDGYVTGTEKDKMQDRSYVLVNIPSGMTNFTATDVFGSGEASGLGMFTAAASLGRDNAASDNYSAVVDMMSGRVRDVYGASYNEGITRRTVVNVPAGSTAWMDRIFGGGYGRGLNAPCDTYESTVNWSSEDATVGWYQDGIYGGNNNSRRTLYAIVNINSPVYSVHPQGNVTEQFATVYGAGFGLDTWCEYTEINLNNGADKLYEVYGGGKLGRVLNVASVDAWQTELGAVNLPLELDGYTNPGLTGANTLAKVNKLGVTTNTNVNINSGAKVSGYMYNGSLSGGYAYAGGLGDQNDIKCGSISGTTYIGLHGGVVAKDIYAGGTSGSVLDYYKVGTESNPIAQTYAYIEGGTVRNVYGGGWRGSVGYLKTATNGLTDDILGISNVTIGKLDGTTYTEGDPSITRNVYGGGEGGQIYGTTNLTINNGHIGYRYNSETGVYVPELDDAAVGDKLLETSGNAFGGGYVANSSVDISNVRMYGGQIRSGLYGGGEIATIGRGRMNGSTPEVTKYGQTNVYLYDGKVLGNVFGGGRGEDNWGGDGYMTEDEKKWMDLSSRGYVFGKTRVYVYGGQVGEDATVAKGDGNVFGGGNLGYVYGDCVKGTDGYYYEKDSNGDPTTTLSEDCKVVVEPKCLVLTAFDSYSVGDRVDAAYMNTLPYESSVWDNIDHAGIAIGNAVFAGGNVSRGSDRIYANTPTVFGNATASVMDIFAMDFIAIGDDGIGGLYGDGNLTLVDGYRELNITNYGTDYHHLEKDLTYEKYQNLNKRQKAYYELKYKLKDSQLHIDDNTTHSYSNYIESTSLHSYTYTDADNNEVTLLFRRGQKITAAQYAEYKIDQDDDEKLLWRNGSKTYRWSDQITENEYDLMDTDEQQYWDLYGFCTLYLGRMMNTIQRADFCGVFGSRIVMRGALDRATDLADYTDYTINRVDEVSLNTSYQTGSDPQGNYFGIYSVVNYLGALTSDMGFYEKRITNSEGNDYYTDISLNGNTYAYGSDNATYYNWKLANLTARKRNNGTSRNQVALASGVWLEIIDKETEQHKDSKTYGPITGVVELDLISVATGEGGGYVYARNDHKPVDWAATRANDVFRTKIISETNRNAVSYKQLVFDDSADTIPMQTTGNFVNSVKRIVDDCYPISGAYSGADAAPAHYWYIRGEYYVYEQTISAYTGSAIAYPEMISIPLTITPESRGKLVLNAVEDNYTAYWDGDVLPKYQSTTDPDAIVISNKLYHKNDPISYWEYTLLTDEEKQFFIADQTYVCSSDVTLNNKTYHAGDILTALPRPDALELYVCVQDFEDNSHVEGDVITEAEYNNLTRVNKNKFARAFDPTNAVNHDNGFLLTFDWDNPDVWSTHYQRDVTPAPSGNQVIRSDVEVAGYVLSPTFLCTESGLYGQRDYSREDLIDEETYSSQPGAAVLSAYNAPAQAEFKKAYMVSEEFSYIDGESRKHEYAEGALIDEDEYNTLCGLGYTTKLTDAKLCISTYEVSSQERYLNGLTYPVSDYQALITAAGSDQDMIDLIESSFSYVYICTTPGPWGGSEFQSGHNYPALKYSNLTASERAHFTYNYDALDVLSEDFEPEAESADLLNYQGNKNVNGNPVIDPNIQIPFADQCAIDYSATYNSDTPLALQSGQTVTVNRGGTEITLSYSASPTDANRIIKNDVLINTEYEDHLINEQYNYTPIVVSGNDPTAKVYHVAKEYFNVGNDYFALGQVVSDDKYLGLPHDKFIDVPRSSLPDLPTGDEKKIYYFCSKPYEALTGFTDITSETHAAGVTVPQGTIIVSSEYSTFMNQQKNFSIDGKVPTATSTLFVSRETDIKKLSEDKIVTLVYVYDYIESDESGTAYETIRERHIVNIRVKFESGLPMIGELNTPPTILPGSKLSIRTPEVTRGAFEPLGGGWEIFHNEDDALSHKRGSEFIVNNTPLYWYQDSAWIAYYSMSYLGKSYSNPVRLSVANYHRMADVMTSTHEVVTEEEDPDTHVITRTYTDVPDYMYLNMAKSTDRRNPKVYIGSSDELVQLQAFYDIIKGTDAALPAGNENIVNGRNIDFIVDRDFNYNGTKEVEDPSNPGSTTTQYFPWTPIGEAGKCFEGTFHGDGHTIGGLDNSLFDYLCGDVYNLGVTGSFNTAGIANHADGNVVNTWIYTTSTDDLTSVNPIVGDGGGIVVNSYYYNDYNPAAVTGHETYKMDMKEFLNGTVAYNLNGHYLNKRYYDEKVPTGTAYSYWEHDKVVATDASRVLSTAQYPDGYDKYVEGRYGNVDFIYAGGNIPENRNIRQLSIEDKEFYPVYPDDYIFFGQTLTYNIGNHDAAHQDYPGPVARTSGDRLLSDANRVFRAPGYYGNSQLDVVHFNKDARFTRSYDGTGTDIDIHVSDEGNGLTAVDFTGYNDDPYPDAFSGNKNIDKFYTPVLDYDGLTSFMTRNITQNLLVYADSVNDLSSHEVLDNALFEPELVIDDSNGYGIVGVVSATDRARVSGHLVSSAGQTDYTSHRNHFLVDKQDFNAPISYRYYYDENGDKFYMWYQRTPDEFSTPEVANPVDRYIKAGLVSGELKNWGWQTISLPFTADLVSTQQKGEITHFYAGSNTGHEYWLREFGSVSKDDATNIVTGVFNSPAASGIATKTVTNKFLWDYYYSKNDRKDKNEDLYKHYNGTDDASKDYYHSSREYANYPLFTAGTPYLIGFPGETYYEFDLSGKFQPKNIYAGTGAEAIGKLNKQTISFVSVNGAVIGVSDTEYSANNGTAGSGGSTAGDYTFRTSYQANTLAAAGDGYLLNSTAADQPSSKFVQNTAGAVTVPFRPYFAPKQTSSPAPKRAGTRADVLYIGYAGDVEGDPIIDMVTNHGLYIYSEGMNICIESTLEEPAEVNVFTTGGTLLKRLTVQPGTKETVPVNNRGIYIVNRQKIAVTK